MHGVCIYSLVYSPCVWMLNTMFRSGSREMFIGWHGNQIGWQNQSRVFTHAVVTSCNMHYIWLE